MARLSKLSMGFARIGPMPFFAVGVLLFTIGVGLQAQPIITMPDIPLLGSTAFGIFSKLGGTLVLIGLGIGALRRDGSAEPDTHIPNEIPRSATSGNAPRAEPRKKTRKKLRS